MFGRFHIRYPTTMIFETSSLSGHDISVLAMIDAQRERLKTFTFTTPGKWTGYLRRNSLARAIQGSNSIEGYSADLNTVVAVVEQEPPRAEDIDETHKALVGYREALTYVTQAAQDPTFEFNRQFLKTLQFMIAGYSMANHPGRWRNSSVFVVSEKTGETVYTPSGRRIDRAVGLTNWSRGSTPQTTSRRSCARRWRHLNPTMIHPFKDGNAQGGVSSLARLWVIARGGLLDPVLLLDRGMARQAH